MKIVTECVYPPIPIRQFDWMAYDDDTYCGCGECRNAHMVGNGETQDAAVNDFLVQYLEDCDWFADSLPCWHPESDRLNEIPELFTILQMEQRQ